MLESDLNTDSLLASHTIHLCELTVLWWVGKTNPDPKKRETEPPRGCPLRDSAVGFLQRRKNLKSPDRQLASETLWDGFSPLVVHLRSSSNTVPFFSKPSHAQKWHYRNAQGIAVCSLQGSSKLSFITVAVSCFWYRQYGGSK